MILILDTSPICFLILIGEIEILPQLFPEVVTTDGVLRELRHPKAPKAVRDWAQQPPSWLKIRNPDPATVAKLDFLDPGEREAVALALRLQPSVLVLDDRVAREEALNHGLEITGLLGLLGQRRSSVLSTFALPWSVFERPTSMPAPP